MYQRTKILQAFKEAGLNKSRSKKVRDFLQFLAENPRICWADAAREFRAKYYDIYDAIIPLILGTQDPLIISNLFKHSDLKNEKELTQVKNFIQRADAFRNEVSFKILAERHYAVVADILLKKNKLPESVQAELSIKKRELELIAIQQRQKDIQEEEPYPDAPRLKKTIE